MEEEVGIRSETAETLAAMPEWARAPFVDFKHQILEIGDVLDMACHGIAMLRGRPRSLEALMLVKSELDEVTGEDSESGPTEEELAAARRQAELAQREVENNFPLLHAQAAVSLWGSLEALIKNFLAALLANQPSARSAEPVKRLKVPLWQFDGMDAEEQSIYIVDMLEQDIGAALRQGATRLEVLLDVFGFGGQVGDDVGRDLYELNQVRHVLVHRRGLADRRLVEACPWLGLTVGQPIAIRPQDFARYLVSATKYFFVVYNRVRQRFGVPPILAFADDPGE